MSEKVNRKGTKEEGDIYVSSTGAYYEAPEVDANKLRDFQSNIYVRGLLTKQKNLVFSDKFTIEVTDAKGETDEELQKTMVQMCEQKDVRLWPKMQAGYIDGIFVYGIGIYNDVWGYEGNEYKLLKLRYLPAYTFHNAPVSDTTKLYSQILQGIMLNDKKEIGFWQTDENGNPQQLKNVFYIKDPATQELAGESAIVPLVPIIEMLKYTWDMQIKQVHRTGAKILFIKVDNPLKASQRDDGVGDIEYANLLLQKWSSNMAFQLRENMTLIDPGIKDDSNNLEIIDALHKIIIDYTTPTDSVTREGAIIGSNEKYREQMRLRYIKGIHSMLESQFEMLLNKYLEYNQYEGYTVSMHIPTPVMDRSEIELKQAVEGFKSKSLTINEIRKRLGAEGLDEKDIEGLLKLHERIQPAGGGGMMSAMENATEVTIRRTETPKKVENILEAELKAASEKLEDSVLKALENEEK